MPPTLIFMLQLGLGYAPWLLVFAAYAWPRLKAAEPTDAHRAIAMLHAFRFFGLVFVLPGVVGLDLPAGFASPAAFGDFATALLAMLALLAFRIRPLFWLLVVAFNVAGTIDLVTAYVHGVQYDLAGHAGQLGAAYAIPMLYVPLLMITHVAAFALLLRRLPALSASRAPGRPA